MSKLAFVDLETTGVLPDRHAVWEIGIVLVEGDQDTRYCWQARPDLTTADPMALKVGRYYERIRDAGAVVGAARRITHPDLEVGVLTDAAEVAREVARLLDGASFTFPKEGN